MWRAAVLVMVWGCGAGMATNEGAVDPKASSAVDESLLRLSVAGHEVKAEVADTPSLRRQGLMHRQSLALDHGMVFVYPDEQPRSFWMKNTLLPLSIAYIDQRGVIVYVADMAPLDERPVPSVYPAMYALEVSKGWFDANGVGVGAVVVGLPGPSRE